MSLNTLLELHMKSKKQVGKASALKNGKTITTETLHLVTNVYENDYFIRQVPEKKDYVSVSKGVHKQKFAACKSPCNLQELYTAFKENTQM